VSTAAGVWLFLVVIEWLADRFAGWLRQAGLLIATRSVCRQRFTTYRPSWIERKTDRWRDPRVEARGEETFRAAGNGFSKRMPLRRAPC
jgi:hypothetical protein